MNVVLDRRCLRFSGIPGSDSVSLSSQDEFGPLKKIIKEVKTILLWEGS